MTSPADKARPRRVAAWLFAVAALVVAMIMVGGLTRLTDSGLSITEWKPVTGAVPPLSDTAWAEEFAKYREIPEYERVNRGMTLEEFKAIYWWEWGHRFLGRFIGVAFLLPLIVFWLQGAIPKGFRARLALLFVLGGLQGAVGWWMVASGLSERVDVSQYRLAAHLSVALLLLGALWWTAFDVRAATGPSRRLSAPAWWSHGFLALVCVQIVLGAFVAGLDAGRIYTDWPMYGGRWLPETYGAMRPFWTNAFENPAAAQVHHRMAGYLVALAGFALSAAFGRGPRTERRRIARGTGGLALFQTTLGAVTLAHAAPITLSALHQLGAVALFLAAISLVRTSRRPRAD